MLKHYWVTALRNLVRNKLFTFINIVGLSLSIAIFFALTGYVRYQFSFDKFYENGERIYRINYFEYQAGEPILQTARTHDRTALLVHEYVPQVEAVTRLYHEKAYVWTENVKTVDQVMLYVDSSFFKVFDVKIISGSAEKSLVAPLSVMVSRSQARVYFGHEEPVGKTVFFNERLPFVITGVFEDIPQNSSVRFDWLLSWSTMPFYGWIKKDGDFSTPWTYTYVKLRKNISDLDAVNDGLTALASEHILSLQHRGHTARHEVQPYTSLHTSQPLSGEIMPGANKTVLYALLSLSLFILIAGWVNYVNLSLAQSLERAEEIGVRKVFGAGRVQISGQFLLEALILSVITFLAGYGLYVLFTGPFSHVLFNNVSFMSISTTTFIVYAFGFITLTALIAFYPASFISKIRPALIMKNQMSKGRRASFLHQGLIVFQFFMAVTIVGITIIAGRQVRYMQSFDTGFNSRQTITLRSPASTNSDSLRQTRWNAFRNDVLQHSAFVAGTCSFNIPGEPIRFHDESVHAIGSQNEKKQSFSYLWVDDGYQETFGLTLLAGRNFNQRETGRTCLINETGMKALGYKSPADAINTTIMDNDGKPTTVIGVLKDYHHESIRKTVDPIVFVHRHPFEYGYFTFLVNSREGKYLQVLEQVFHKHYPDDQFVYYFVDSYFEAQYASDELFGKLLNLFSVISIVVACLGLFGMASLSMVKRTREIGIRKVLGASVMNILTLISRNYIILLMISCALAFPLAYYLTTRWLQQFSYKITVQWWMVVLPGVVVLAFTILTIATQCVRAALKDPARTLRED
jgi:putative ABC transport system permease protein